MPSKGAQIMFRGLYRAYRLVKKQGLSYVKSPRAHGNPSVATDIGHAFMKRVQVFLRQILRGPVKMLRFWAEFLHGLGVCGPGGLRNIGFGRGTPKMG